MNGVVKAHRSYRHEALLYRDNWGFLDAVVPFILDGLALEQPVMVAVIGSRVQAIRAALGNCADKVAFVNMAELGQNPARIIPAWQRFVESHADAHRPLRGIGEPVWAGRREVEIAECQLHEALLNIAISPDTPLWLMCPYDINGLDHSVIGEAHRSHPVIVESGRYRGSTDYSGAYHVERMFTRDLPEPPDPVETVSFAAAELGGLMYSVARVATVVGLPGERASQLASAVLEIAADGVSTGDTRGSLRMWREGGALICEIHDPAVVDDPLVGRAPAAPTEGRRRGLWRANQLCDLIQVRSNGSGTTVRVHTWI